MKTPLLIFALSLASVSAGFGYDGTFGFGIELTGTGANATNNGVTTLYVLDQTDPGDQSPTGSTAMQSLAWTAASTEGNPTFNLGTFTLGDTLTLNGGSLLSYQGNGDTVDSATVNYEVGTGPGSGTFPSDNLPLDAQNFGNAGNKRFALETGTTNLLAGLAPGTYELSVYGAAVTDGGAGGLGETNGGANYGATFTVAAAAAAPEPGTTAMLLLGVGGLIWSQRRRFRLA